MESGEFNVNTLFKPVLDFLRRWGVQKTFIDLLKGVIYSLTLIHETNAIDEGVV